MPVTAEELIDALRAARAETARVVDMKFTQHERSVSA